MSRTPRLADTLPETQRAFVTLQRLAAAAGICATLELNEYGAFRTAADTSDILGFRDADYGVYVRKLKATNAAAVPIPKATWRKIAPFGQSYHDYGAAFDVTLKGVAKTLSYSDALKRVGALAPKAGLRWGGTFGDPAHFELALPSIAAAAARWNAYQATRAPASLVTDAGQAASDAADHAAAQTAIAAEQLVNGGISPVAAAIVAVLTLGTLGAIVARRMGVL